MKGVDPNRRNKEFTKYAMHVLIQTRCITQILVYIHPPVHEPNDGKANINYT